MEGWEPILCKRRPLCDTSCHLTKTELEMLRACKAKEFMNRLTRCLVLSGRCYVIFEFESQAKSGDNEKLAQIVSFQTLGFIHISPDGV